jgi:hypothetical protein
MIFIVILCVIFWIFFGGLSCDLRSKKGYEGGFWFAILFGIIALIYNAGLPDKNLHIKVDKLKENIEKTRPYFKNENMNKLHIDNNLHCSKKSSNLTEESSHKWRCSVCGNMISNDECPFCGNRID